MQVERLDIAGLVLITPTRIGDDRGWFTESWNSDRMAQAGLGVNWVQDSHSFSVQAGTLRGLHYHAQARLVRCTRGAIRDVAVEIRIGSSTYLPSAIVELTTDNNSQLFIPVGFAHGFLTVTKNCEVPYKCSALYAPESDRNIRWNDPGFSVQWDAPEQPILSEKDAAAPFLAGGPSPFIWEVDK